jgi:hypothetical protein
VTRRGNLFDAVSATWKFYYTVSNPLFWLTIQWIVTCLLNFVWLTYAIVGFFRKLPDGRGLILDTEVFSWRFLICYLLGTILEDLPKYFAMLPPSFMWIDGLLSIGASAFLILSWVFLAKDFQQEKYTFLNNGYTADVWFHRIFIHNTIAISAAWSVYKMGVVSVINFHFDFGLALTVTNFLQIVTFIAFVTIFCVVDLYSLDKYQRYLVSPYLIWLLTQVDVTDRFRIARVYPARSVRTAALILLLVVSTLTLVKIAAIVIRQIKKMPLDNPEEEKLNVKERETVSP